MDKQLYIEITSGEEGYYFTKEEAINLLQWEYDRIVREKSEKEIGYELSWEWMTPEDYAEVSSNPDKPTPVAASESREGKGWTALFTDEKEWIEYLKWRRQPSKQERGSPVWVNGVDKVPSSDEGVPLKSDGCYYLGWYDKLSGRFLTDHDISFDVNQVRWLDESSTGEETEAEAIAFAEWCQVNKWVYYKGHKVWDRAQSNDDPIPTKELYKLFKQKQ